MLLVQRRRGREGRADSAWDHEHCAGAELGISQPVVVGDHRGIYLVGVGEALHCVAGLDRHHHAGDGRDDDLLASDDRVRVEQAGVGPAQLADRDVELGGDRREVLTYLHRVDRGGVARNRRGWDCDRLDDRAVASEADVAEGTALVDDQSLCVQGA